MKIFKDFFSISTSFHDMKIFYRVALKAVTGFYELTVSLFQCDKHFKHLLKRQDILQIPFPLHNKCGKCLDIDNHISILEVKN